MRVYTTRLWPGFFCFCPRSLSFGSKWRSRVGNSWDLRATWPVDLSLEYNDLYSKSALCKPDGNTITKQQTHYLFCLLPNIVSVIREQKASNYSPDFLLRWLGSILAATIEASPFSYKEYIDPVVHKLPANFPRTTCNDVQRAIYGERNLRPMKRRRIAFQGKFENKGNIKYAGFGA